MRCDVNGNVWAASNAGRAVGYSGVTVWSPEGKLLGRFACPRCAATSPSAAPSATACSWPRASRSTLCIRQRRARDRASSFSSLHVIPRCAIAASGPSFSGPGMTKWETHSLKFVTNSQPAANPSGKSWAGLKPGFYGARCTLLFKKGRGFCTNARIPNISPSVGSALFVLLFISNAYLTDDESNLRFDGSLYEQRALRASRGGNPDDCGASLYPRCHACRSR